MFCSVADLLADAKAPGDETALYQAIQSASDYLQKEIGWFIPVTLTRNFHGRGRQEMLIPPLLTVTSIVNDEDTLVAADYILQPEAGFWPNGPYGKLLVGTDPVNLSAWIDEEDGVTIVGKWGLYQLTKSTGAEVDDATQQSDSQTTLQVDNAGLISPGMVLLIGNEQELVTGWSTPIDSATDITEALTATGDVLTLGDATKVHIGEILRVGFEQMKVLDLNTTTNEAYVGRGWNKTAAVVHADNSDVYVYRTLTVERGVNGTTAAAHLINAAISRYVAPDDILFLVKEIATLMLNKAASGYQGRTGNDQGVIFYNDAFPRQDIERVKQAYSLSRFG